MKILSALTRTGILLAAAGLAHGMIAPILYQRLQDRAPEFVTVRLVHVKRTVSDGVANIAADAEVVKVHRSLAGLRAGQHIRIEYSATLPSENRGRAGGCTSMPMPLISQGDTTVAFLHPREGGKEFGPAAGYLSFTPPVVR